MKENKYDDARFFEKYGEMERSRRGLAGAGEWPELQKLLPDFRGKAVLDLGCGYGWHCRYAAEHGAQRVEGTDISERMLAVAKEKCQMEQVHFVRCAMEDLEYAPESFDVVILDPPAFTKSRSSVKNAVKGYREINLRGMRLVRDRGFLATCSCSHFMESELFAKTIREAAQGAHRRLRQVEFRTQACDHPILWAADQSFYLKFYIFQVVNEY